MRFEQYTLICIKYRKFFSPTFYKVNVVCQCKEFIDLKLRNNEKKVLNTLNKDKNRVTIRYTEKIYEFKTFPPTHYKIYIIFHIIYVQVSDKWKDQDYGTKNQ